LAQPPLRSVSRPSKTVVRVEVDASAKGFEWWVLLSSDRHHDNAYCNQKAEKAHLDLAKERGAGIIDIGDLFDAMNSRADPRGDRSQIRPENFANNYFDTLVDAAADFYAPYCDNWLLLSPGNHETAALSHHGTNLSDRLADAMRYRSGAERGPMVGTYQGWVALQFKWGVRNSQTYKIRYTHGYGGGGPATKDTIQAQRQLAYLENCDFLLSGHTHDAWYIPQQREYLDDYGNTKLRDVAMIKVGGYKCEFSPGGGWAVGKGIGPKPIGGWWVRFYMDGDRVLYEVTRTAPV
jgi:hypothetical protein